MGQRAEALYTVRTPVSMTGDVVLSATEIAEQTVFVYTPTAARNLTLPDASSVNAGVQLMICNAAAGAYAITVKSTAQATIVTPGQNEACWVVSSGERWFGIAGANS